MGFTCCTIDDFKKVTVGQELKINGRYEELKRENGQDFEYVARKDDIVVVQRKTQLGLIVRFFEDVVRLKNNWKENYGEFLVEPNHIQKIESI